MHWKKNQTLAAIWPKTGTSELKENQKSVGKRLMGASLICTVYALLHSCPLSWSQCLGRKSKSLGVSSQKRHCQSHFTPQEPGQASAGPGSSTTSHWLYHSGKWSEPDPMKTHMGCTNCKSCTPHAKSHLHLAWVEEKYRARQREGGRNNLFSAYDLITVRVITLFTHVTNKPCWSLKDQL